jgi:hypothetical protein
LLAPAGARALRDAYHSIQALAGGCVARLDALAKQ